MKVSIKKNLKVIAKYCDLTNELALEKFNNTSQLLGRKKAIVKLNKTVKYINDCIKFLKQVISLSAKSIYLDDYIVEKLVDITNDSYYGFKGLQDIVFEARTVFRENY